MDVRKMADGWRMLAVFPMTAPYSNGDGSTTAGDAGYEVCAEHRVISGAEPVYVIGRTVEPGDPELWMDVRILTDAHEAMGCSLARAGWNL